MDHLIHISVASGIIALCLSLIIGAEMLKQKRSANSKHKEVTACDSCEIACNKRDKGEC